MSTSVLRTLGRPSTDDSRFHCLSSQPFWPGNLFSGVAQEAVCFDLRPVEGPHKHVFHGHIEELADLLQTLDKRQRDNEYDHDLPVRGGLQQLLAENYTPTNNAIFRLSEVGSGDTFHESLHPRRHDGGIACTYERGSLGVGAQDARFSKVIARVTRCQGRRTRKCAHLPK